MIQRGHGARLSLEPFGKLLLGSLDRDDPVQARVEGAIHLAHASRSDGRLNLVGSEPCAGFESHRVVNCSRAVTSPSMV